MIITSESLGLDPSSHLYAWCQQQNGFAMAVVFTDLIKSFWAGGPWDSEHEFEFKYSLLFSSFVT